MRPLILTAAVLLAASSAFAAPAPAPVNTDPAAVQAGDYKVETSHTRVQFTVNHFGFSDWYGDFTGVTGTLHLDPKNVAASKVEVTIPVASVSTTNAKLDEELRAPMFLDAAQYPTIRFVSTKVVQTAPGKATITGDLTFHGVTKPVTLEASFNGSGPQAMRKNYAVGFNATGRFKRSDFGAKFLVPMVGDETTLRISAAFEK